MFATVMIEVGLYITKTLKSDMVTQKAKKFQKRTEDKRFDDHYSRVKAANSIQSNEKYADELVKSGLNESPGEQSEEIEAKKRNQQESQCCRK
jgi:hypothetical protein